MKTISYLYSIFNVHFLIHVLHVVVEDFFEDLSKLFFFAVGQSMTRNAECYPITFF